MPTRPLESDQRRHAFLFLPEVVSHADIMQKHSARLIVFVSLYGHIGRVVRDLQLLEYRAVDIRRIRKAYQL